MLVSASQLRTWECEICGEQFTPSPQKRVKTCSLYCYRRKYYFGGPATRLSRDGVCTMRDCERPRHARGLCNLHYKRRQQLGSEHAIPKRYMVPDEKECTRCGEVKQCSEYYVRQKANPRGFYLRSQCRTCMNWVQRLNKYGVTEDDIERMLLEQSHSCAICEEKFVHLNFRIDHCHRTNRIRGLLCNHCNVSLGYFEKHADIALRSAQYLEEKGY